MDGSKNILVTGASGFIGRNLTVRLSKSGHTIYPISKLFGQDICDKKIYQQYTDKCIDTVFHLAGLTFVPDSWDSPDKFYQVNTMGTQRVLDFCRQAQARIIFISAYIYGNPRYLPIDESHPVAPNNPYAHSKWLGEELCRFYAEHMGVKTVILRPFNIYGNGQDSRFLIPTLLNQIQTDGKIVVRDDTPRRDYLYITDVVDACMAVIDSDAPYRLFNVGSGYSLSVREIVKTIRTAHHDKSTWQSLGEKRPNEIPDTVADCSAIKKEFNWQSRIPFTEGLRDMLSKHEGISFPRHT